MRSPLNTPNTLAFNLFQNIRTLNLLNSVVQNHFQNLNYLSVWNNHIVGHHHGFHCAASTPDTLRQSARHPHTLRPTLLDRFPDALRAFPKRSSINHKIYLHNIIIPHISSSAIPSPFQASFSLTFIMKKRTNNGGWTKEQRRNYGLTTHHFTEK